MKPATQWIGLCVWIGLCFGAAAIGASATTPRLDGWYTALAKPGWTPPDWLFGPVWSALFLMMAVSAWLVWRRGGFAGATGALALFLVQLGLNSLWSVLFFGMQMPGWAAAEIVVLWGMIAATLIAFERHSLWASLLLWPYLAWVSFAAVLNVAIWRLNV